MTKKALFWCVLLLVLLTGTVYAQETVPEADGPTVGNGTIPPLTTHYRIVFEGLWSQQTHPHPDGSGSFPANARFSPPIGALHNGNATLWKAGDLASPGLEEVAETGGTTLFSQEIDAAITAGNADRRLLGSSISSTGVMTLTDVPVSAGHPYLTLAAMIAPSPDWFTGVSALLLQEASGQWVNQIVIDLYPFDAGTEEGTDYATFNPPTAPPQPVRVIAGEAPFSTQPVARLTITRLVPVAPIYLPLVTNGPGP